MVKRFISFFAVLIFIISCCLLSMAQGEVKEPVPEVTAQNVYMVNMNTGAVVYEKGSDEKIYPASLTKLVTLLVAAENITDYSEIITVSDDCYDDLVIGSSSISLKDGEQMSLDDIMYAIAISSANEAANALASHLFGSVPDFVAKMNEKAQQLGAESTHFANTHGLHSEEHYTTARDMASIAKAAFENETVLKYLSTSVHEIAPTNKTPEKRTLVTTNSLLRKNSEHYYKYCRAGKTGTTTPAGYNLVSVAQKGDTEFLLVAMHVDKQTHPTNTVFSDSRSLYNWAFDNYKSVKILENTEIVTEVNVELSAKGDHLILVPEENVYSVVPIDLDISTLKRDVKTNEKIFAPVTEGDVLGSVTLSKDGVTYATVNLVAGSSVERSTVLYYLHLIEQFFSNLWVRIVCIILGILVVIYIIIMISQNKRRRRKKLRRRIRF